LFHLTQSFYQNTKKICLWPQYRKQRNMKNMQRNTQSVLDSHWKDPETKHIKGGALGLVLWFFRYVQDNQ
jgi:hypothetical protein